MAKVSIVVPIYKAENFLSHCIDTILNQTFAEWELILVDDGSPDKSGSICDEYAERDERIKVIHKTNGGVSTARNIGIREAIGEWITFIDADDYVDEHFLDIPIEAKEDLLIKNYEFQGDENRTCVFEARIVNTSEYKDFLCQHLHSEWLRVPWGKFYKTKILQKYYIEFPEGVKIGEDSLFVLSYLDHACTINFINKGFYFYICNNNYERYYLPVVDAVRIFNLLINSYKKLNISSTQYLSFIFRFYWGLINPTSPSGEKCLWYKDAEVNLTYKKCKNLQPVKWKLKYNYFRILSLLAN